MSTVKAGRSPDLWLLILAFIIAVSVKFAVHDTEQITERVIEAQVTYTPPGPQWVSYDKIDKVKVGVRAKASDMSRLSVFNLEVVAEIPPNMTGSATIVLDEGNVRFNVSGDFEVVSIDPKRLTVRVEPKVSKMLPVSVELFGEPAAGARAGKPRPKPAQVQVTGPESRVLQLQHIDVQVSLEGHARPFEDVVKVQSPDPLVQVVQPNVITVEVPMEEPELTIGLDELSEDENDADSEEAERRGT